MENIIEQVIITNRFIRLQCVQERNDENIHVGEIIYADITSLLIDKDGDSYMMMYDAFGICLGFKKLGRFRVVK